jgi:hypothetical protein
MGAAAEVEASMASLSGAGSDERSERESTEDDR